jgi:hypothetical protein
LIEDCFGTQVALILISDCAAHFGRLRHFFVIGCGGRNSHIYIEMILAFFLSCCILMVKGELLPVVGK